MSILKKLSSYIIIIILILIIIFLLTSRRRYLPVYPSPQYVTDTLYIGKPDWVINPSWVNTFRFKISGPSLLQPIAYEAWIDSVWTALSIEKSGSRLIVHMKKEKQVVSQVFSNVGSNFSWYGLPLGGKIVQSRFSSLKWLGIQVGLSYSALPVRDYTAFIESGIKISRLYLIVGVSSKQVYTSVKVRLW